MKVSITAGQTRVWLALLASIDAGVPPAQGVAEALGITPHRARNLITKLAATGLVTRRGHRLEVVRPYPTSVFHAHGELAGCNDRCQTVQRVTQRGPQTDVGFQISPIRLFPQVAGNTTENKRMIPPVYNKQEEGSPTPSLALGMAVDLKKFVAKFEAKDPVGGRARRTPDADLLETLYVERRRKANPECPDLGRTASAKIAKLVELLGMYHVPRSRWGEYLDHVFEAFRNMTGGRASVPPVTVIASESFVDSFSVTLPAKKYDARNAARMLAVAGFNDVQASAVLRLAQRYPDGNLPNGLSARTAEAVVWLLPRMKSVGFVEAE